MHAINTDVTDKPDKTNALDAPSTPDAYERRRGDRRSSAHDRRFWRALRTERRSSERRRFSAEAKDTAANVADPNALQPPLDPPTALPIDLPTSEQLSERLSQLTDARTDPLAEPTPAETPTSDVPDLVNDKPRVVSKQAQSAERPPADTLSTRDLQSDETTRRAQLRSMLNAADQRQARNSARRLRRPVMTAGLAVRVVTGSRAEQRGVVADADYINGRALVEINGDSETGGADAAIWIDFRDLAAAGPADADKQQ